MTRLPAKPTNQASRNSCVVPVLPPTGRPPQAAPWGCAARPVPRATTASIIRRIAAACSGVVARVAEGGAIGTGAPSAFAAASPRGRGSSPPLAKAA
jgi:hypothetical protein